MENSNSTDSLLISKEKIVYEVLTTTEASDILGVDTSYLIKLISKGEFLPWEYRKTGRVILFRKDSILDRVGKFHGRKNL